MKQKSLLLIVALIVVAGVAGWWWEWGRSPRSSDLRAVADSFVAPGEWKLVDETIRDRAPFCIDVACPSVAYRWETDKAPTSIELRDYMLQAGWQSVQVEGNCLPKPNRTGGFTVCSADATHRNLQINVAVSGPQDDGSYWISMSVEEP